MEIWCGSLGKNYSFISTGNQNLRMLERVEKEAQRARVCGSAWNLVKGTAQCQELPFILGSAPREGSYCCG